MAPHRRDFLAALGVGAVAAATGGPLAAASRSPRLPRPVSAKYDMSWIERIRGKHRAVFDSPELSDGMAMYRAAMWRDQLKEVYGIERADSTPVLVIRHSAISMAMTGAYWQRFEVGKEEKVKDGKKWSERNMWEVRDPKAAMPWAEYNLTDFMASGGIVLVCDLAFGQTVSRFRTEDKKKPLPRPQARELALQHLIPGMILQPSGFFAVLRAQEEGCGFIVGS